MNRRALLTALGVAPVVMMAGALPVRAAVEAKQAAVLRCQMALNMRDLRGTSRADWDEYVRWREYAERVIA